LIAEGNTVVEVVTIVDVISVACVSVGLVASVFEDTTSLFPWPFPVVVAIDVGVGVRSSLLNFWTGPATTLLRCRSNRNKAQTQLHRGIIAAIKIVGAWA
jgi:hypothetical protein